MQARSLADTARWVWLASVVAAVTIASDASAVRCWQDPVIYHTNGMRRASSTSQRNHNVYWQPDLGHVGYCDGVMNGPCKNELRMLGH